MQGSAEFRVSEEVTSDGLLAVAGLANGTDGTLFDMGPASLREAAAARVAAHRNKRAGAQAMDAAREEALREEQARVARESRRGAAKVRDAVRARYEQTQSYRDFLAAEAERAMQHAQAEAEIAARNAKAIADAQMQLLEELREQERAFDSSPQGSLIAFEQPRAEVAPATLDQPAWNRRASFDQAAEVSIVEDRAVEFAGETADLFAEPQTPVTEISTGGLIVRLYEDTPGVRFATPELPKRKAHAPLLESEEIEELEGLEQEIAFRRAPQFEDHIIETLPIPANLIEFPRELVATRKARPRLAEGPLREEMAAEPQLRIFEVEQEQISIAPAAPEEVVVAQAPMWQGLMLDAAPVRAPRPQQHVAPASLVDIAPISRRLMSAVVDACCVGVAMIGFWTVAAWISGPRLTGMSRPMLAIAVVFTAAIAAIIYQVLFFWLNEATPGMRYARIALCTFAETNPTRRAMRRRLLAMLLALCPLGLGLLWAWMDGDRLAWHDRISRVYQRMY